MLTSGNVYSVMNEGLLPELASNPSDLLPTNTQIFSSTVYYGRVIYAVGALTAILTLSFLLAAMSATAKATMGAMAAVSLIIGAVIVLLLARRARKTYETALTQGGWHLGVIVFPSGDVVVRINGLLKMLDRTIEAVYLSRADVERRFAPHRCSMRYYLRIYYLGVDARPGVLTICETELRDSVLKIADFINDTKSRNMSSF